MIGLTVNNRLISLPPMMVEETDKQSTEPPLTSKELLERTGISRATLNNYVSLGLLPRPDVRNPGTGKTPRLGYFPASALATIEQVNRLKKRGHTMAEIVSMMTAAPRPSEDDEDDREAPAKQPSLRTITPAPAPREAPVRSASPPPSPAAASSRIGNMALTLDQISAPAYLVNYRFEVEWANTPAQNGIFGQTFGQATPITERNLFRLFLRGGRVPGFAGCEELLRFHLSIAKSRVAKATLIGTELAAGDVAGLLFGLYDEVEPIIRQPLLHTEVNLARPGEVEAWHTLYASFYREGIFFTYAPVDKAGDSLLALLARRDIVIRDLLRRRRPYLTDLAVLVADIQDSVKICAELPPEEYFELINDVWGTTEPKLRKFYATHGKHAGDGMVCYFFPQPDCNYALNALRCAQEMKETMREISRAWQSRKQWVNELRLNIGVHEGQEWFGTYQTSTHLEFTVLGDTINTAGRLSDFARRGAIWATKDLLGKLTAEERARVRFGIRRTSSDGEEILVPSTYARVANLIDLGNPKYEKFNDIATLPVTEILDVLPGPAGTPGDG